MKRILYILLSVCFLASCSNEIPDVPQNEREGRVLLAYLVSNNDPTAADLDVYLKYNVISMYYALTKAGKAHSLVVYYRPKTSDSELTNPCLLSFESDSRGRVNGQEAVNSDLYESLIKSPYNSNGVFRKSDVRTVFSEILSVAYTVKEYEESEHIATDPEVMKRVLDNMQEVFVADSYGLIYGSHATSWLEPNKSVSRSFGDDSGYSIDIPSLADVLASSFSSRKLDFVLFDACMMGTAEVAYELRDVASYCIASVMETPAEGFPYKYMLDNLYAQTPNYQQICTTFASYFQNDWGTCAVVDCAKTLELAEAVAEQLQEHASRLGEINLDNVQQYGENTYRYFSYDVGDYIRQLNGGTMPEAFQQVLDEVVVAKSCVDRKFITVYPEADRFCGIGMYLPDEGKDVWDTYYRSSISWYQAVGWESLGK